VYEYVAYVASSADDTHGAQPEPPFAAWIQTPSTFCDSHVIDPLMSVGPCVVCVVAGVLGAAALVVVGLEGTEECELPEPPALPALPELFEPEFWPPEVVPCVGAW